MLCPCAVGQTELASLARLLSPPRLSHSENLFGLAGAFTLAVHINYEGAMMRGPIGRVMPCARAEPISSVPVHYAHGGTRTSSLHSSPDCECALIEILICQCRIEDDVLDGSQFEYKHSARLRLYHKGPVPNGLNAQNIASS